MPVKQEKILWFSFNDGSKVYIIYNKEAVDVRVY